MPNQERPSLVIGDREWDVFSERNAFAYRIKEHPDLLRAHVPPWCLTPRGAEVRKWLFVVDSAVVDHHAGAVDALRRATPAEVEIFELTPSEQDKTMATVLDIATAIQAAGLGVYDGVVGIGGGIIMDEVRVAAALAHKGIYCALVPTTWVAMVDAAVGTKCAINLGDSKNYLGRYEPADYIALYIPFLHTLTETDARVGLAETVKVGEVHDLRLFELLDEHGAKLIATRFDCPEVPEIMARSLKIVSQIADDPQERRHARWPSHCHTLAGGMEAATGWTLPHGFAVSADGAFSGRLSHSRGLLPRSDLDRMLALRRKLGLPTSHPLLADLGFLERTLASTVSKRGGHQHWPVPAPLGTWASIEDATPTELHRLATRT